MLRSFPFAVMGIHTGTWLTVACKQDRGTMMIIRWYLHQLVAGFRSRRFGLHQFPIHQFYTYKGPYIPVWNVTFTEAAL